MGEMRRRTTQTEVGPMPRSVRGGGRNTGTSQAEDLLRLHDLVGAENPAFVSVANDTTLTLDNDVGVETDRTDYTVQVIFTAPSSGNVWIIDWQGFAVVETAGDLFVNLYINTVSKDTANTIGWPGGSAQHAVSTLTMVSLEAGAQVTGEITSTLITDDLFLGCKGIRLA